MGSGSWAEIWEELGWRKGFAVISANIRRRGFRFQLLTAGKEWGEYTSKKFSKEHTHPAAGKGRSFSLHFVCVGNSNRENTENSLVEVVPVQPWISPDLPLAMLIILSLLGTRNFQIWLGIPKTQRATLLAPADVGKHQGQRKGSCMLEFPIYITAFAGIALICLFK